MGTGTVNSKRRFLESLKTKHKELDKKIKELYNKYEDDDKIKEMKFEKLNLKTQIVTIETELAEA